MNETKLQAPIRIKLDYKRPGKAERDCIEVVAEEFIIPGSGKHRFAVHGSVMLPGEFTASHIETGFSLASGETIEKAIELAREKWAAADPEKISLAIIRARNHTKVKHAAPAPATWSSATAPGPDGMQHCTAVPGMPSASDIAYEDDDGTVAARRNGELVWHTHIYGNDPAVDEVAVAKLVASVLNAALATPAPVQQAAPSDRAAFEGWHSEKFGWMSARCSILNRNYADQRTQERWETWQAAAAPAQPVGLSEAIAWVHTMHMECDQSRTVASLSGSNPFGEQGKNYSASYRVESVPAYAGVGLSEQEGKLREQLVSALGTARSALRAARIATKFHAPHADDAIDAAILAAKEAP